MNFASILEKRCENSRFALFNTNSFALKGERFSFIREIFAFIRESYAFIRDSFALIRESFALIRKKYNFFSTKMSPIGFRIFPCYLTNVFLYKNQTFYCVCSFYIQL